MCVNDRKCGVGRLPRALEKGDRIAIVSPASRIDGELIDSAVRMLEKEGYVPVVMPHARGVSGSFSGSAVERLSDLRAALEDESVRAVLCSRGGYGAVHLLEPLESLPAVCFDKWLIGFSDITALHCLWLSKGMASMHGAMAKYIGRGAEFGYFRREMDILAGKERQLHFEFGSHPYNHDGYAVGRVVGGNMAVLGGLVGTRFFPVCDGDILFVEDIAEPIYKVERMLWQLRLCGVFDRIGGLVVGQFTEYRGSVDYPDMETMIENFMSGYDFPRAYGVPCGHIDENCPLILGAEANLAIENGSVSLRYE